MYDWLTFVSTCLENESKMAVGRQKTKPIVAK